MQGISLRMYTSAKPYLSWVLCIYRFGWRAIEAHTDYSTTLVNKNTPYLCAGILGPRGYKISHTHEPLIPLLI